MGSAPTEAERRPTPLGLAFMEILKETGVAEFMLKYRGLMVYHCIIFALLIGVFRKLHAEISVEIKKL